MAESFGIGFVIGASLSSSLSKAFGSVNDKLKETQKSLGDTSKKAKILERALVLQNKRDDLIQQLKLTGDEKIKQQLSSVAKRYRDAKTDALAYSKGVKDLQTAYKNFSTEAEKLQLRKGQLNFLKDEKAKRETLKASLVSQMPSAMLMTVPVNFAIDFESSMADVKKVTDFSDLGFKEFSNELLQMSSRLPVTASGLAEIAAAAGQAGIAQEELLSFTEDAAKMGTAFDMSAKEAGEAMTGLRSIFHLEQQDVRLLGDSMNALSNKFNAKASEIVNFANRTGGTATIFKMTGQEISALGAAFLNAKVGAEEASTATNSMLAKLGRADSLPKEAQKAFEALGMSGEEMSRMFKEDAQGALLTFLETVQKSDDPMRYLSAIFGEEHAPKIAKLVGGLDNYKEALSLVAEEQNYATSMEKEYENVSNTTESNLTKLKGALTGVGIVLGQNLLPLITNFVTYITPAISNLAQFASEHETLTSVLMGVVVGYKALNMGMTFGEIAFSKYTSIVKGAPIHFENLQMRITTTKTKMSSLHESFTRANSWGPVFSKAKHGASVLQDKLQNLRTTLQGTRDDFRKMSIASSLASTKNILVGTTSKIANSGLRVLKRGVNGLKTAFATALGPVSILTYALSYGADYIIENWDKISPYFTALWGGVKKIFTKAMEWMQPFFDAVGSVWDWFFGDEESTKEISLSQEGTKALAEQQEKMKELAPPSTQEKIENIQREKENQLDYSSDIIESQYPTSHTAYQNIVRDSPVSATFSFTLNGVDDADFANRVIQSIQSKKSSIENILNEIVNNQVRLSYGR